jgi:hypothetical protein
VHGLEQAKGMRIKTSMMNFHPGTLLFPGNLDFHYVSSTLSGQTASLSPCNQAQRSQQFVLLLTNNNINFFLLEGGCAFIPPPLLLWWLGLHVVGPPKRTNLNPCTRERETRWFRHNHDVNSSGTAAPSVRAGPAARRVAHGHRGTPRVVTASPRNDEVHKART